MPALDIKWRTDSEVVPTSHIAIVVDVLRACTNLITAFSMGAARCYPTTDLDEARQLARQHNALLIGERHNKKLPGFDYGNSPLELEPARVRDATIVFTSTNFPHALRTAENASEILLGALVNLTAVSNRALTLATERQTDITIMLAGEPIQKHAAEDLYFASRVTSLLQHSCTLAPAALRALEEFAHLSESEAVTRSLHAQDLIKDNFGRDVDYAFQTDHLTTIPHFQNGIMTV